MCSSHAGLFPLAARPGRRTLAPCPHIERRCQASPSARAPLVDRCAAAHSRSALSLGLRSMTAKSHGHAPDVDRRAPHGSCEGGGRGTTCLRRAMRPLRSSLSAPHVTPQVVAVLEAAQREISAPELQAAAALKDRVHFLKGYLEPMLAAGWLERTIPDKPRSRNQN